MYFVIRNKAIEKDRFFCFCYFLTGLVFVFGIFIKDFHLKELSLKYTLEQLSKITFQSNLLAFITGTLYLFRPNHRIFITNWLPLMACSILWLAGIGFWFLLFPIYYIDLSNIIISVNEPKDNWAAFYVVWNHSVTQIFFFVFFYYLSKKKNISFLNPITAKKARLQVIYYLFANILWNALSSFLFNIFPTYGILTNYNPNTQFFNGQTFQELFNVRLLLISHISTLILALSISYFFSLLAIKWRSVNNLELLGDYHD